MQITLNKIKTIWVWIGTPMEEGWISFTIYEDSQVNPENHIIEITDNRNKFLSIRLEDMTYWENNYQFFSEKSIPIIELNNIDSYPAIHLQIKFTDNIEDKRIIIVDKKVGDIRIKNNEHKTLKIKFSNKEIISIH